MMNDQPIISVIIPVYNGARHLRRCIDSVIACGFEGMEILALNDGSTDGSVGIIAEYQERYPKQVRSFSHENIGVARTRNKGVDLARGEYILFLDQDDWFDKDYIETFYRAIKESGADVVIGGYRRPDARGDIVLQRILPGNGYYRFISASAWGKIHRASYLKAQGIRFFDNKIGEDVVFSLQEATSGGRFSFVKYIGYNWYLNEESVSETEHKGFYENIGLFVFLEKLGSFDYGDERIKEYCVLKSAFYYLMHSGRTSSPEKYKEAYAEIMGWVEKRYPAFVKNKFLNFGLPGETFKVRLAIHLLTMIHRMRIINLFAGRYCKGREV